MRYTLQQFKEQIPELSWDANELADKLSAIGHEAETNGETIDVTLTSNRKDCQELQFLVFDLAGVYDLKMANPLGDFGHGPAISVTASDINKLLGSNIDSAKLKNLERLGFIVSETGVQPPDFRDVATVADVAEEIVRLIGYAKLTIEPLSKEVAPESARFTHIQAIKYALVGAGWTETATSSFGAAGQIELKNPFTDNEPFLRASLQAGLLQTLAKNPFIKRGRFFEIGDVFTPNEVTKLGLIISGQKDLTAISDQLSKILGVTIALEQIDPITAAKYEAKQGNINFAEVDCNNLDSPRTTTLLEPKNLQLPIFKKISKYPPLVMDNNPPISRDISITSADAMSEDNASLINNYRIAFPELVVVELIDEYQNPETKRITKTFRLILQNPDHTFTDSEIKELDQRLLDHFFQKQ